MIKSVLWEREHGLTIEYYDGFVTSMPKAKIVSDELIDAGMLTEGNPGLKRVVGRYFNLKFEERDA